MIVVLMIFVEVYKADEIMEIDRNDGACFKVLSLTPLVNTGI